MLDSTTPLPGWRGGDGNAAYLDKTLRHEPIEMSLNESVTFKVIFFLWLRAVLAAFVVGVIPAFIGFLVLMSDLGESSAYDSYGGSSDSDGSYGVWFTLASLASFVVFWLALLMSRLPEPVAEWRVLLADRTDRAQSVYGVILTTLTGRRYPLAPAPHGTRITLTDPPYVAYVSVFNYGDSLYLGWMMWRSRRGTELMGQFLGDIVRGLKGQNGIEHQLLRSEGARAMREAVHLACREGLMAALDGGPAPTGAPGGATSGGFPRPSSPPPPRVPPVAPPVAPPAAPPATPPFPSQPQQQPGAAGGEYGAGGGTPR
ncbi:hypothetical protein ABZ638_18595 [Streptomyces sp. NPDC007107]|uniref:hypothetical protein n=1 Tax=Streptomyces sp. NPDC007107 TaxID=3156915 RepID=UPI00340707A7